MAWVLEVGKFQHRVHGLHTLGAEDKQVVERDGLLFLSASNPTLVNEKLTPTGTWIELQHGDVIQIGRRRITVLQSRFFLSGPLMLLLAGGMAFALLLGIASAHELSFEMLGVLLAAVVLALGVILFFSRKSFWSFRALSLNMVFAVLLSAAFAEGMFRFADAELHVAHARVPASLVDTP